MRLSTDPAFVKALGRYNGRTNAEILAAVPEGAGSEQVSRMMRFATYQERYAMKDVVRSLRQSMAKDDYHLTKLVMKSCLFSGSIDTAMYTAMWLKLVLAPDEERATKAPAAEQTEEPVVDA